MWKMCRRTLPPEVHAYFLTIQQLKQEVIDDGYTPIELGLSDSHLPQLENTLQIFELALRYGQPCTYVLGVKEI